MAHVVTEKCNGCKFTDCVEVCPVACFYEMDTQVVIHADDCIDCMACVEVCPVHAIYADADVPTEYTKDIEFNLLEANQIKDSGAPAITVRKDASTHGDILTAKRPLDIETNLCGTRRNAGKRDYRDRRQRCDGSERAISGAV